MAIPEKIDIEKYRYSLPDSSVAKYPLAERDQSKLLLYNHGHLAQYSFRELPQLLPQGSWLVFNNTRVIQARLLFRKSTGARIEIFCLEPTDPVDYQQSFQSRNSCSWKCLVGNARKWKKDAVLLSVSIGSEEVLLEAQLTGRSGAYHEILFNWVDSRFSFGEIIECAGSTPIPPYLDRAAEESDRDRYQTIYSRDLGSVAAPTAGLHFTEGIIQQLEDEGFPAAEITLHVGAGTFIPVKDPDARNHPMHAEHVTVSRSFLERWAVNREGLIAVGTTSMRSLESLYWLGVKLISGEKPDPSHLVLRQWENENLPGDYSLEKSMEALVGFCKNNGLDHLHFSTGLMIVPGYSFRTIRGLITNFHLPGSTLLLLIAALIGDDWKKVYDYALGNRFRFLSYGDSSLLLP